MLKGEKLKSLMTELKAHEKLILALKKRRHTIDKKSAGPAVDVKSEKDWDNWDGSSFAYIPSVAKQPEDKFQVYTDYTDDEVRLDEDLRQILSRFHLTESLATRFLDSKPQDDYEGSDNHINSIKHQLSSDRKDRKRFQDPRAEQLFQTARQLAQDVAAAADADPSSKKKQKQQEFDQWFTSSLERDIETLDARLGKVRYLEQQLEDERRKVKGAHNENALNWESKDVSSIDDVKKRLKDMKYKASKSEKEISERIASRRLQEFPTSRSEGEL